MCSNFLSFGKRATISAPIHNVGKIRLPKEMFLRLDELTEEEEKLLKTHPELVQRLLLVFQKIKN